MIQGYVDEYLQAKIPIVILGKNGNMSTLDAVVDTGFTGDLCISIYQIRNSRRRKHKRMKAISR